MEPWTFYETILVHYKSFLSIREHFSNTSQVFRIDGNGKYFLDFLQNLSKCVLNFIQVFQNK